MRICYAFSAVALMCAPAIGEVLEYHPALGTLPEAQGWNYSGSISNPASVSGAVMSYGPTSMAAVALWDHQPIESVDFTTQTWWIEADVRLTDTSFGNVSGFRRGGFILQLQDDAGRAITADIGSSMLGLRNDNEGLSDPAAAFDLASAFHRVRLEAGPGGSRLLVDGSEILTLGFGSFGGSGGAGYWGEGSILASTGLTEVREVRMVPGAGTMAIGLAGAMMTARRRRVR